MALDLTNLSEIKDQLQNSLTYRAKQHTEGYPGGRPPRDRLHVTYQGVS